MTLISGRLISRERRVERRRLARAGRAGDEQRAGRPREDLRASARCISSREAELGERRRLARLVEEAHRDRLALDRRQRRDADVEQPARGRGVERDAAVLRLAPLGDVELREHLQPRRDAGGKPLRDALRDVQHAVDAVADDERVLLRLEVDVAGAVLGRLEDDRVDEPDERRVGDAVVGFEVVLASSSSPGRSTSSSMNARSSPRPRAPGGAARSARPRAAATENSTSSARREPELVEAAGRSAGSVIATSQRLAVERERDRADALEHGQRDHLRRLGVDARDREVDERQVVLLGEAARDAERAREALVDQRVGERAAACARVRAASSLSGGSRPLSRIDLGDELARRRSAAPSAARARSRSPPASVAGSIEPQVRPVSSSVRSRPSSMPQVRVEDRVPREQRDDAPSARNGPNGILIFRAAPAVAGEQHDGRHERRDHARTSARPAPCARARRRAAARASRRPCPCRPDRRAPRAGRRAPRRARRSSHSTDGSSAVCAASTTRRPAGRSGSG